MDRAFETAEDVLQSVFGYEHFRGEQKAVIDAVVNGQDAAVIMPTGAGKSLCYQIPAVLRGGCAVIVSPLIALMADQVLQAEAVGLKAAAYNSAMSEAERFHAQEALSNGTLDLLFVAPERAVLPHFRTLLEKAALALFAIDEAHCVSQWGHDFRPDYRNLGPLLNAFPNVPRIALTATADEQTRQDILNQFGIDASHLWVAGFDRANIFYEVSLKQDWKAQLFGFLKDQAPEACGIVYCQTRKSTEGVAEALRAQGYEALAYHAGLDGSLRAKRQSQFLRADGIVMVATVAFGMGINKPNVRYVVHLGLPKSVEAYYQETGRAGRDGALAHALMLYDGKDIVQARWFIERSDADEEKKRGDLERLQSLLSYCDSLECRRVPLLRYFGDQHPGSCGHCDTCLNAPETEDVTEPMRMLLSAIWRTEQRFGLHHVVDVLRGSQQTKIKKFRHDQLSVYGIGADRSKQDWLNLGSLAAAKGYIAEGDHGARRLTQASRPVLQNREKVLRRKIKYKAKAPAQDKKALDDTLPQHAIALLQRLKAWRLEEAKRRDVPAFFIFSDSTVRALAAHRPRTNADLRRISGIGAKKADEFGAKVLDLIDQNP